METGMIPRRRLRLAPILALLLYPSLAAAVTWTVPGDAATIQDGLDMAAAGDTVLVGSGTWSGAGNVNLGFGGIDIVLLSSDGRDDTIIDCGDTTRGLRFTNGETAAAQVRGFTIRDGNSTVGGGLVIDGASPEILDCRFVSCYASQHGGAVDIQGVSAPEFRDCLFDSNATIGSFHWAGAVRVLADAVFVDCIFLDNRSDYAGGAVQVGDSGDVGFESCVFQGNSAREGGAVADQSGIATSYLSCTFTENRSTMTGGAFLLGGAGHTFTDCLFDRNVSDLGGVMYVTLGDAILQNCTVVRTTSSATSAAFVVVNSGSDIDLNNTIIHGSLSGAAVDCQNYGDVTPVCSNLYGNADGDWDAQCGAGENTINGNLSAPPRFCDPLNGDFTLAADSPCLAANNGCGELVGAFGQGCETSLHAGDPVSQQAPAADLPARARLSTPYPNPFNPRVTIPFTVDAADDVRLTIHDAAGREVIRLLDGAAGGRSAIVWEGLDAAGRPVAAGAYFVRLVSDRSVSTRKVTVAK